MEEREVERSVVEFELSFAILQSVIVCLLVLYLGVGYPLMAVDALAKLLSCSMKFPLLSICLRFTLLIIIKITEILLLSQKHFR